jgi:SH3-like domain-containing protein
MMVRALVVLCLITVAMPVAAQLSPPPGSLQAPPKGQSAPPANPARPRAAPRIPVQRVAPSKPASKPTPVVPPPRNTHAQRPPPPRHPPPAAAATAAPKPPPAVVAPVPAPEPAKPAEPEKGSVTGLPLPRWAALRSDEVNMRAGPGTRYPVDWVYRRRDLPVEIEREFEVWRLVRDQDGVRGWVHEATLVGRRSFVVMGADRMLRSSASDTASPVALLKVGVVGRIRSCQAGKQWCEMQVGEYRGWLKRTDVWGVYPDEAVN